MNPCKIATLSAVFALGFSCVVTQLIFMREMLAVFAGNELVLGVVLGNWLLLMGLGSLLGGKVRPGQPGVLAVCLIVLAILPALQVEALRSIRGSIFLPGEAIGVLPTVLVSFLVLAPYCVNAGFLLAVACSILPDSSASTAAGKIYTMDSIGSVVGGLLFSFVLVLWLDHIALLVTSGMLNLLASGGLAVTLLNTHRKSGFLLLASGLAAAVVLLGWLASDPDSSTTARQFPGQRLLLKAHSPYGRLLVTRGNGQTNVIQNGVVLVSTPNIEQAEESVLFALGQRPNARKVLLIGGLLSGATREVLLRGVTSLDCVELDPALTAVGRQFFPTHTGASQLHVYEADARRFVRATTNRYDVVIIALPDPTTAQINRFFTFEFFQELRRILEPEGVLSFAVGHYENFAGPELSGVLSCARTTALNTFQNVILLPAGRVYFLASDGPLSANLQPSFAQSPITPLWVTSNYLSATLAPDRLRDLERAGSRPAPVNYDFHPVLYYRHLLHWASQFQSVPRWVVIIGVSAVVLSFVWLRPATRLMFASGFAGSALEVSMLLLCQTMVGSVYRQVAWLITLFMAGLAFGAWLGTRQIAKNVQKPGGSGDGDFNRKRLFVLASGVAACAALLSFSLPVLAKVSASTNGAFAAQFFILLFVFTLASITGAQFPFANAFDREPGAASRLYTADFVGAFIGAVCTSIWLLPLAGVAAVAWVTAGLNLAAAIQILRAKGIS